VTAILGFDLGLQLLTAHSAIGDLGAREQEVDDLVLEQRRAQLGGGHRFLADIFDELLAVARAILLRGLHDQLVHLLAADFHPVRLADLGEEQTEADAALGDGAIFLTLGFHLGAGGLGIGLVRRLMLELLPDLIELRIDHGGRNREIMSRGELVEQLALHVGASEAVQLLLDLALEEAAQLVDAFEAHRLGEIVVALVSRAICTSLIVTSKTASRPFR
jgi:hypothetical protein